MLQLKDEMDHRKAREQELLEVNQQLEQTMSDLNDQHRLLQAEQEKSEQLLLNILPQPIAERLKQKQTIIADGFANVTVLFADIAQFTKLSVPISPEEVVAWLNTVCSLFDELAEKHGLEKIKEPQDIGGGELLVDFNLCYNPFCAYTDAYSCPIPPFENHLTSVAIWAGEKDFKK